MLSILKSIKMKKLLCFDNDCRSRGFLYHMSDKVHILSQKRVEVHPLIMLKCVLSHQEGNTIICNAFDIWGCTSNPPHADAAAS